MHEKMRHLEGGLGNWELELKSGVLRRRNETSPKRQVLLPERASGHKVRRPISIKRDFSHIFRMK